MPGAGGGGTIYGPMAWRASLASRARRGSAERAAFSRASRPVAAAGPIFPRAHAARWATAGSEAEARQAASAVVAVAAFCPDRPSRVAAQ